MSEPIPEPMPSTAPLAANTPERPPAVEFRDVT